MSKKSLILSILSAFLFIGIIVGIVFMFKTQFIIGFISLFAILIPVSLNRKAISEANGKIDELVAKFLVPVIAFVGLIFVVLYFALWA